MRIPRTILLAGLLSLALSPAVVAAPIDDLPQSVREGFKAYPEGSYSVAIDAWMRHAVVENAADLKNQLRKLEGLERLYGTFENVDIVHRSVLSSRAQRIYVAMHFERGAAWLSFDVYQKRDERWVINAIGFATNPSEILPEPLLIRGKQP